MVAAAAAAGSKAGAEAEAGAELEVELEVKAVGVMVVEGMVAMAMVVMMAAAGGGMVLAMTVMMMTGMGMGMKGRCMGWMRLSTRTSKGTWANVPRVPFLSSAMPQKKGAMVAVAVTVTVAWGEVSCRRCRRCRRLVGRHRTRVWQARGCIHTTALRTWVMALVMAVVEVEVVEVEVEVEVVGWEMVGKVTGGGTAGMAFRRDIHQCIGER